MGDLSEKRVKALFQEALKLPIGTGMAAAWGHLSMLELGKYHQIYEGKTSFFKDSPGIDEHSFFDLASLTKVLATTSVMMSLDEASVISLEDSLEHILPEITKQHPHLAHLTLESLLSHTSGLPAWSAIYQQMRSKFGEALTEGDEATRKEYFYEQVFSEKPTQRIHEKMIYSDLGFLILSYGVEKVLNEKSFACAVEKWAWSRIPWKHTLHFRPIDRRRGWSKMQLNQMVTTLAISDRGLLAGEVQDDNAWSLGGVAGHAGVFGTLRDVVMWVRALMSFKIVSKLTLEKYFKEATLNSLHEGERVKSGRAIGFDMPSFNGQGATAHAFSHESIGHLGYTGTSLWIDLNRGFFAVLLTNQTSSPELRKLRQAFHETVGGIDAL